MYVIMIICKNTFEEYDKAHTKAIHHMYAFGNKHEQNFNNHC